MHAPQRHPEPVLASTEKYSALHHAVALYDQETRRFRMWYFVRSPLGKSHAYAESADGVRWEKPNLGLVDLEGSRDNNLLPTVSAGATGYPITLLDNGPQFAPPDRRFMMMSCRHHEGVNIGAWALFSPDGIHWESVPENPVLPYEAWEWTADGATQVTRREFYDHMDVFYDPAKDRYVFIVGMLAQAEDGYVGQSRTGPIRRIIGQSESKDFIHWSKPRRIIVPEDKTDMTEFYNMSVLYRNGLYIGFVRVLRDDLPADPGGPVEGIGWTELAISRDGDTWTRLPGVFYDRHRSRGEFDHAMAWLRCPVCLGPEMFFYYWGFDEGHKVGKHQIGLARAPEDRFLALRSARESLGTLVTKAFQTPCERLSLNANSANGSLRIQICDAKGKVLPGYSFEDCVPITGDGLALPMRWGERETLPQVRRQGVVFEIEIRNALLYAVNMEGEPA